MSDVLRDPGMSQETPSKVERINVEPQIVYLGWKSNST